MNSITSGIWRSHNRLTNRWLTPDSPAVSEIIDLVSHCRASASQITAIEDRDRIRKILRLWGSRLVQLEQTFPDTDIDSKERRPARLSARISISSPSGTLTAMPVGKEIPVHDLAGIEAGIRNLYRVIVVAHCVEAPTNSLRKAVERNFGRGVRYMFLVSKSQQKEINGYWQIFRTLAKIVLSRRETDVGQSSVSKMTKRLVTISRLDFDWRNKPYIFYQARGGQGTATIAFRGNQKDQGIACRYAKLDQEAAHTLALALLSDAPLPLRIRETEFRKIPSVERNIKFPARLTGHARVSDTGLR